MHKNADAAGLNTITRPASYRWIQVRHGLANPEQGVFCNYGDGAFSMTAYDTETANRLQVPYIVVVGNNSTMNQISYGQLAKYGQERGNVGDLSSDLLFAKLAEMLGTYGEEVHAPALIPGALPCARESVEKPGHVCRRQHLDRSACVRGRHDAQTMNK